MSNRCFRPVRPEDVERIAQIAVRAWQPIYAYYREALGEELFARLHTGWEERKADQVRQAARARPDCVYVTEIDGAIAGFITFMVNPETGVGEIGNNAVDPECQTSGIGTAQHREALRIMRERGMHTARVTTGLDPAHAPARRSYEKAGFDHSTSSITYYMDLSDL
ncbi:MAG TPA: GNAT family N-acetyltransferase [Armatimonadota bacterium]|jgi:ribosomal protein S18 acetylase RimI-like enzyme|nr:GNAT family N-acetyltransferase [Armatimonadota bacterium]HOM83009.1 GNAT family N-acetyltransferase [Armatimonadota bacterium]HPO71937.1 GNAT family N-acetyltransferase [Armatimonadota bacterium]HPT96673.1 GNAT family N-acetyltransferase [Armatimonadota bacterium]